MAFFNRFTKTKKNNTKQKLELPVITSQLDNAISRDRLVFNAPETFLTRTQNAPRVYRENITRHLPVPVNTPVNITRPRIPLMNNNTNYIFNNLTNRRRQRRRWMNMATPKRTNTRQLRRVTPSRQSLFNNNTSPLARRISQFREARSRSANLFNNEQAAVAGTGLLNARNNNSIEQVNAFNNQSNNNNNTTSLTSENRNSKMVFGRVIPRDTDIIMALNNGLFEKVINYLSNKKPIDLSFVPIDRASYSSAKGMAQKSNFTINVLINGLLMAKETVLGYAPAIGLNRDILEALIDYYKTLSKDDKYRLFDGIKHYMCQYIRKYEVATGTKRSKHCP